jgi:hypothetical protein
MARDQEVDGGEFELDEEGFAGPVGSRQTTRRMTDPPMPGNGSRRNGSGDDAQAELTRLRAENARLRAVAGLEGRRDEPPTVGDVLDANAAQVEYIRSEIQRGIEERGEEIADYVAACVEERLLEPLGLDGENDDARRATGRVSTRKTAAKRGGKRRGLRKGELFYEADGSGPFVFGGDEDDEVDDDGRRGAFG